MIDGQPEPKPDRVRFTGTADIERLLADTKDVRTALLEEGVPATAFRVVADAQLTILRSNGHRYIRFATARNRDPVAVELPPGRVVEMVTRRHHCRRPSSTSRSTALHCASSARSGKRFTPVSPSTLTRRLSHC